MKICSKCKETKPFEDFGKLKASKDGLHYKCKKCIATENNDRKEYMKMYYESNKILTPRIKLTKEQLIANRNENAKKYREKNLEKCKARCNSYKEKNKEILKEKRLLYDKTEKAIEVKKNYRKTEKYKTYQKQQKKSESNIRYLNSDKRKYVANFYATKKYLTKQIGETPPPELVEIKLLINKTKQLCKTSKNLETI